MKIGIDASAPLVDSGINAVSDTLVHGKTLAQWERSHPLTANMIRGEPVLWRNPEVVPFAQSRTDIELDAQDIANAASRLERFAPWLAKAFPEVNEAGGIIESELREVPKLAASVAKRYEVPEPARFLVKLDSQLPISGSVKARGGIYEVLFHAEKLARQQGLLNIEDDYRKLEEPAARALFKRHSIVVGSTGNLGLAIGIAAARLGFSTTVHMSHDARSWKKEKLRCHGVNVIEHTGDYGLAVEQGRRESEQDPTSHFVDDENSRVLFLGYSVAGMRLKAQLAAEGVEVSMRQPLVVYLPCGVGGGPGGIAFGLKHAFGDAVHCVFAEPTQACCMLLGMYTGLHDKVTVGDFCINGQTAADGLAVARPSGFVGRSMHRMIDAIYSLTDEELHALLYAAHNTEGLRLEPSAVAGMPGFARIYLDRQKTSTSLDSEAFANATHIMWATGGGMVPDEEYEKYLFLGKRMYHANQVS